MRQDPATPGTWFWLLEWNQSFRLVGAITPTGEYPNFMMDVPSPEVVLILRQDGSIRRCRHEIRLDPDLDDFFDNLDGITTACTDAAGATAIP